MTGQLIAASDPHRQQWHLAPAVGLLNDPNGFIQANGRYHLFYQWNPLACRHGAKWWGHWSSADLVHWQHEPVALLPTEDYEISGCYSGSAVQNNGKITLIYTGNVKYTDGSHNPIYGDGGGEKIGGKPNLVSYTKRARIKYMGLQDRQTLAGGSNVNYPWGTIRMKVDSDTYSIIRKAKKIKIDDRLCELIGAPARPGPFFPNYWTIELRQID